MIGRIVLAQVVGIMVWIGLTYLVAPLLISLALPVPVLVGTFFAHWSAVVALVVAVRYFFGYDQGMSDVLRRLLGERPSSSPSDVRRDLARQLQAIRNSVNGREIQTQVGTI